MANIKNLIKVAADYQENLNKFAGAEEDAAKHAGEITKQIQQALANASAWAPGQFFTFNFINELKKDDATMSFYLTVNNKGKDVKVSDIGISQSELKTKYASLIPQIQKYLQDHWELFPQNYNYNGLQLTIAYQ